MSALERLGIVVNETERQECSDKQLQTRETFAFKWANRSSYESEAMQEHARRWELDRYCNGDPEILRGWLSEGEGRKIILDAGCGSGFSALLFFNDLLKEHDYLGVDISEAVKVAKARFDEKGYPGDFVQYDIMNLPIPDESVDLIFSEGVLHHTDSVHDAILNLTRKLKNRGYFLFYVYRKKAVLRELADDVVRQAIQDMNNEEAWKALLPLTMLGKSLGELAVEIEVKDDIPVLGISKGRYDLQRFFYWNICKLFYRPDLTIEEMNHINFDWYRPLNCHRHTPEEIALFCTEAGLITEHFKVEEAGITVVARKQGVNTT